eukprot:scaffold31545_cov45-Isochrysis_galbana.AAC.1
MCRPSLLAASVQQLLSACRATQRATLVPVLLMVAFCCYVRTHLRAQEWEEEQASANRGSPARQNEEIAGEDLGRRN